jgi:predicted dienelactone hydrolase
MPIARSSHRLTCSQQLLKPLAIVALGFLSTLLTVGSTPAAEKLSFTYGPFQESLSVSSLEAFANTGTVNSDLNFYFKITGVNAETKAAFRAGLSTRPDIDPILLSRFFYSEIGEDLLTRLGRYINMPQRLNGKYALRSALILAALDPDGLTLVNVLRQYPTEMWIDVRKVWVASRVVERVIRATTDFPKLVSQIAAQEAAKSPPVDFSQLPDLRQPGSLGVEQQRWQLTDARRNRQFYVDVYRPQRWRSGPTPVVIISHGLSSRPEDFDDDAKHLASYGYVVALPQHPGSDYQQTENLQRGLSQEVFLASELIDRPRDISYVIDELERRNATEFAGRLNLQSVGVLGHSLGGYTALAVAGAAIDFDFLEQQCNRLDYPNTSLLVQCRALTLPRQPYHFRDQRVSAVLAANPVNYDIFGPQGLGQIQIPVMIGSGSYDPATPAVFEQALTFPALTTPDKYLAVIEGQAHVDVSKLDAGFSQTLDSIPGLILPAPTLIQNYANALELAFLEVHLVGNSDYRPYLQPAYADYLSRAQEFKLFLLSAASDQAWQQAIANWQTQNPPIKVSN